MAATLPTTLGPTADLIQRAASKLGRTVEVTTSLAEGAFDALRSGDGARHDALVQAALRDLASRVDVIVLAQASMARAVGGAESLDADGRSVPILTSPRLGVQRLRGQWSESVVRGTDLAASRTRRLVPRVDGDEAGSPQRRQT